jgi:hypothetical protein
VKLPQIGPEGGDLSLYTNQKVKRAFEHLGDFTVVDFAHVLALIEAAYKQGRKDGADAVFTSISRDFEATKKAIPHGKPGRPGRAPKKSRVKRKVGQAKKAYRKSVRGRTRRSSK